MGNNICDMNDAGFTLVTVRALGCVVVSDNLFEAAGEVPGFDQCSAYRCVVKTDDFLFCYEHWCRMIHDVRKRLVHHLGDFVIHDQSPNIMQDAADEKTFDI